MCFFLVFLVEVGWLEYEVIELIFRIYLVFLLEYTVEHDLIDIFVLGCIYYLVFKLVICFILEKMVLLWFIVLVDSVEVVIRELVVLMGEKFG